MILEIIRKVPINLASSDKYVWHYDKCGNYSAKSVYRVFMKNKIRSSSSNNSMAKVWSNLWKLKVPAKVKHFCWKTLNGFIPTRVNLHRRGIQTNVMCPRCSENVETTDHILVGCKKAQEIWDLTFVHNLLKEDFNQNFADRWFEINSALPLEDLQKVAVTYWAIWSDRNNLIHNSQCPLDDMK